MGAGNKVDDSDALMIRANKGERASMWCFASDVGSGSSSHNFVADARAVFFTSEDDAGSSTSEIDYGTAPLSFL